MNDKIKIRSLKERSECLQGTERNYSAEIEYIDNDKNLITMNITGFGITRGNAIKNAKYKLAMLLGAITEFREGVIR